MSDDIRSPVLMYSEFDSSKSVSDNILDQQAAINNMNDLSEIEDLWRGYILGIKNTKFWIEEYSRKMSGSNKTLCLQKKVLYFLSKCAEVISCRYLTVASEQLQQAKSRHEDLSMETFASIAYNRDGGCK